MDKNHDNSTEQPDQRVIVYEQASPSDFQDGTEILDEFLLSAQELVARLRRREEEFTRLFQITERLNYGVILEDVLEYTYREMRQVIPYNRIGFSLIDQDRGMAVARWARSDRPMFLECPYEAPLAGSTLQDVLSTGRPRIINNLEAYLLHKPSSKSTALIVLEGMRSSLTCPLIVQGRPVGFVFFSSVNKNEYSKAHVSFFRQIAGQLAATVEKGRLYTALAAQKDLIAEQNAVMTRDLEMARQVQRTLVPAKLPPMERLDIALHYEPAVQVGGDVLDVIPLDDGKVFLFVGDAVGHGVRAALVMSVVKTALRSSVSGDCNPAGVLKYLDGVLRGLFDEQFVTAASCLLDQRSLKGRVSLAGHPPLLVFRSASGRLDSVDSSGLPLGITGDGSYSDFGIDLQAGDAIVLYTDGIIEAFNAAREPYLLDRFKRLVREHGRLGAADLLDVIRRDLKAHSNGHPLQDDLTLMVVKVR